MKTSTREVSNVTSSGAGAGATGNRIEDTIDGRDGDSDTNTRAGESSDFGAEKSRRAATAFPPPVTAVGAAIVCSTSRNERKLSVRPFGERHTTALQ